MNLAFYKETFTLTFLFFWSRCVFSGCNCRQIWQWDEPVWTTLLFSGKTFGSKKLWWNSVFVRVARLGSKRDERTTTANNKDSSIPFLSFPSHHLTFLPPTYHRKKNTLLFVVLIYEASLMFSTFRLKSYTTHLNQPISHWIFKPTSHLERLVPTGGERKRDEKFVPSSGFVNGLRNRKISGDDSRIHKKIY